MRIIAGKFYNKPLKFIKNESIRPVSSKVREAIFNIIDSLQFEIDNANVLDVCCGTGVFSIEAASRGAKFLTLIDLEPQHLELCRENLKEFGLQNISKITRARAEKLPKNVKGAANLIFIDPPYKSNIINQIFDCLIEGQWLAENCLIVTKQDKKSLSINHQKIQQIKEKIYANTKVSFFNLIN